MTRRVKVACATITPSGKTGRRCRIRTCDLLVPNQALYQTKLIAEIYNYLYILDIKQEWLPG